MQYKTQTTPDQLKDGDRFYKVADKSRTVYQVAGVSSPKGRGTITYDVKCVADGSNPKYPVNINSKTEVIFLRHTK